MASAAPLKDIDEQFLQCAICLSQLTEPTLLPCLHRYCRGCLKKIVKEKDKKVQCPTCREKHDLPPKGVDGFKADFNTQNIIEFIQLQDSVKHEPLKVCINCNQKLKVASYCFRCSDFLCQSCDEHHKTSRIVQDHQPHIFSLEEAEARSLTIEKLSSLNEAPRCRDHPEKVSELCCTTCDNLPICIACVYGAHQGHVLKEVKSLAKVERERLTKMLEDLKKYEEKIYKQQKEIKFTEGKLSSSVDEKTQELRGQLDINKQKLQSEIRSVEEELKTKQAQVKDNLKKNALSKKQELEETMRKLKEQYEKECEAEKQEADTELDKLHKESEEEKATLQNNLDAINTDITNLLKSIKTQEQANTRRIQTLSDNLDAIVKKYEVITTTAHSILAAKNDWTDVQCIPDIRAAIDPLMKDVKTEIPKMETLSTLKVREVPHMIGRDGITVEEESVVHIKGVNHGWYINDIATSKHGSIVITGHAPDACKTFISVINSRGECLRLDKIKPSFVSMIWRFCDFISRYKIVTTTSTSNEIGIYDIRDGTYRNDNFFNIMQSFKRNISCIAVDPSKNHILVGEWKTRELIVLSSELKYLCHLKLQDSMAGPREITVLKNDNLLVCGWHERKVSIFTKIGSEYKLSVELRNPDIGKEWRPSSACKDKNGWIYVLWVSPEGQDRGLFTKHSKDGTQLKVSRPLDPKYSARRITTVNTEQGEKILITTYTSGELLTYGLGMSVKT